MRVFSRRGSYTKQNNVFNTINRSILDVVGVVYALPEGGEGETGEKKRERN